MMCRQTRFRSIGGIIPATVNTSECALSIENRIHPPTRSIWHDFTARGTATRDAFHFPDGFESASCASEATRGHVSRRAGIGRGQMPRARECRCVIRTAGRVSAANQGAICYACARVRLSSATTTARQAREWREGAGVVRAARSTTTSVAARACRRPRCQIARRSARDIRTSSRPTARSLARTRDAIREIAADTATLNRVLRVDDGGSLRCHYVLSFSTSKRTRPNTCYVAPVVTEHIPDVDVRPPWPLVPK